MRNYASNFICFCSFMFYHMLYPVSLLILRYNSENMLLEKFIPFQSIWESSEFEILALRHWKDVFFLLETLVIDVKMLHGKLIWFFGDISILKDWLKEILKRSFDILENFKHQRCRYALIYASITHFLGSFENDSYHVLFFRYFSYVFLCVAFWYQLFC